MIPINKDSKKGCVVISSSCVSWQGGEIKCIEQCSGDTLQDTIIKIGDLLCLIYDYLTPITYNLSCFNFGNCPPDNFHDLLQFILDELCKLQDTTVVGGEDISLSSIIIPLPKCLQYVDDFGSTVTQLQLYNDNHEDYLTLIGNSICSLEDNIDVIESNIANINQQITSILNTLQNNNITLIPLNTTPLFSSFSGMSTPNQYAGVINQLMQYIQNISATYNNNTSSTSLFMTISPIQSIIDDMMNNHPNHLCSLSSLSLTADYTIVSSLTYLWEYIKDIRTIINNKICNPCQNCNNNQNIIFYAYFTNKDSLEIHISIPSIYIIDSINYSIYGDDGHVFSTGTTANLVQTIIDTDFINYNEIYIHYSGCMIDNTTGETCKFDYIITVYNDYIECKHINVNSISIWSYEVINSQ